MDRQIVSQVLKLIGKDIAEADIVSALVSKGFQEKDVLYVIDNIDDNIVNANSLFILTPINPISYCVGAKKAKVVTKKLWGLFTDVDEIGIRLMDSVKVIQHIIGATVVIVHSDQSEVTIEKISKRDASKIREFLADVIDMQRTKAVNISQD